MATPTTPTKNEAAPKAPPVRTKTVVINNRESLVQGQLPHIGRARFGANGEAIPPTTGKVVTLIPGVNFVNTDELNELIATNPGFAAFFKTKIPHSLAPEQTPEKVGKPILEIDKTIGDEGVIPDGPFLSKLDGRQAESVISETLIASQLNEWLKEEVRAEVRRAIYAQLEKITGQPMGGPATAGR